MLDPNKRVDAYRNLNKPGTTFSIRQSGRVVEYQQEITLSNVRLKHASPTQQEACKSRRLVCQWVSGILAQAPANQQWQRIECDPKKHDGFRLSSTHERIDSARFINLSSSGCFVIL